MRTRIALWGVMVVLAASSLVNAQTPTATSGNDERLNRLEQRLSELEEAVRSRDEEIARLKAQRPSTSPATAPAVDDIEQTKQDVLRDIESRSASPLTLRTPASFTPDVAVIVDGLGSWSSQRSNDAYNRFDVREVELDLRAAVDPRVDGVVILAFERDVHNPVFPELGEEEEEGLESNVNIEEAYGYFHDFGVPNLTAKVGRFHVRFGRQNMLHLHDLPTSDPPLVNQAFLAPEALVDSGLSLSYVIPPKLVADQYIELIAEITTGEGAHSESPTLSGDIDVDSPAFNFHALWNHDLTREINLELGSSWLTAHRGGDNAQDLNLFGLDVTLIRRDPTGGFNNQILQGEMIYGIVDQPDDASTQHALGCYVLGQQQLNKDFYTGVRLDWTEDPNNDAQEAWAISPYLSWYWSEFLRLRVEYQHRNGDIDDADVVFFQATYVFGAHPPHPYWSMR